MFFNIKSKIKAVVIISFCLCFYACNPKSENVRRVEKLGETPWTFIKEEILNPIVTDFTITLNGSNFTPSKPSFHIPDSTNWLQFNRAANFTGKNKMPYGLCYQTNKPRNIKRVKVCLGSDQVALISYLIELYNIDENGNKVTVQKKEVENKKPMLRSDPTMDFVGENIGYTENIGEVFVAENLSGNAQYVNVNITSQKDYSGKEFYIEPSNMEVFESDDVHEPYSPSFNDSSWSKVALPHCFNEADTYLNGNFNDKFAWKGDVWYRKNLFVAEADSNKRLILEFQNANIGAAVYINGVFQQGTSKVPQYNEVTHVGSFLPFALDITDDVKFGENNIIAVKVGNGQNGFFRWPAIGTYTGFCMGLGALAEVDLHYVDPVHIPLNMHTRESEYGTYIATVNANEEQANVRSYTNVRNASSQSREIKVVTKIIDAKNKIVDKIEKTITVKPEAFSVVENDFNIRKPQLWYPNNSPYGKPYLYNVVNELYDDDIMIDEHETTLGIRTVTWDDDYCYINGKKHILNGFGHRNIYPALGSALPAELQWRDMKLIADCGGNTLRLGHFPATLETIKACNAYGILVMQNSGDNEWSLHGEPTNSYKREFDKEMILAFRNDPSVIIWESNNGIARGGDIYWPSYTLEIAKQYDPINTRIIHTRDSYPSQNWDKNDRIMVGYTNYYAKVPGSPTFNAEVFGGDWTGKPSQAIYRADYKNEKRFCEWYLRDYLSNMKNSACGWIDWLLVEDQLEAYTVYLDSTTSWSSLGSCAMDGNRIPKLKYNIYKNAFWIPFEKTPGVTLQSSWDMPSEKNVDAWSNCPQVELFVNGTSRGVVIPDPDTKRCTWNVDWKKGEIKAVGLDHKGNAVCEDIRKSSGKPYKVVLTLQEQLTKPNGDEFKLMANGSDVAIVHAKVVDKEGNLCTMAENTLRFEVAGEGVYKGSYNLAISKDKPITYHSPGDPELNAEGGQMKIAIRSTFTPGTSHVKVVSDGLIGDEISYSTAISK